MGFHVGRRASTVHGALDDKSAFETRLAFKYYNSSYSSAVYLMASAPLQVWEQPRALSERYVYEIQRR